MPQPSYYLILSFWVWVLKIMFHVWPLLFLPPPPPPLLSPPLLPTPPPPPTHTHTCPSTGLSLHTTEKGWVFLVQRGRAGNSSCFSAVKTIRFCPSNWPIQLHPLLFLVQSSKIVSTQQIHQSKSAKRIIEFITTKTGTRALFYSTIWSTMDSEVMNILTVLETVKLQ